jgi:WD40 repeat protein
VVQRRRRATANVVRQALRWCRAGVADVVERALLLGTRMGLVRRCGAVVVAACVLTAGLAWAREPHRPHQPRPPRAPKTPQTPDGRQPTDPTPPTPANQHFVEQGRIALPGRGLALAWSPDGTRIATGGRFRDKVAGLRYDTRIADVGSRSLQKSFACHYFYVVATAWNANPYLGEIVADGGGDHAVKLWNANGPGSVKCKPGQLLAADGGTEQLGEINGWITGLAFSPDGRFLAGASRDRMTRIWQMAPGERQFEVIGVVYDKEAGNLASVVWRPDGKGLYTSDRRGHVTAYDFDPDTDAFDDATVATFANVSYEGAPSWCQKNPALTMRAPLWRDTRKGWIWNVRVSPDGSRVAAVGDDGLLVIYDAQTGDDLFRGAIADGQQLHGLDWSPDGTLLAIGGDDGVVYLTDANGAPYDRLEGHQDAVAAVAWSPDGATLASTAGGARISQTLLNVATGPDQTIRLWARP